MPETLYTLSIAVDYNEFFLFQKSAQRSAFQKGLTVPRACVSCVRLRFPRSVSSVFPASVSPSLRLTVPRPHTVRCVRLRSVLPELLTPPSLPFLLLPCLFVHPTYYPTTTKTKQQIQKENYRSIFILSNLQDQIHTPIFTFLICTKGRSKPCSPLSTEPPPRSSRLSS